MICLLTVIPVRREPNDRSEIITQLLFGETCVLIEEDKTSSFIKIKADFDGYEGWVDKKQLIENEQYPQVELKYSLDVLNTILHEDNFKIAPLGAVVNTDYLDKRKISFIGENGISSKKELLPTALKYLNTPYLWGGKSQFGIDCSGFVQQVFKICNINLPRDAYQQADIGEKINFDNLELGDLAYFGKNRITHVGIILENKTIIHAHGFVRISRYDENGIVTDDLKSYSHQAQTYSRV